MRRSRRLRAGGAIALLGILAVALSGCDFLGEYLSSTGRYGPGTAADASSHQRAPRFLQIRMYFEDLEEFLEGRYEAIGPGQAEVHDKVVTGRFRGMLPFRTGTAWRRATASSGAHPVGGTYIADLNGTTNSNDGTAQMKGIGALVFKDKTQGVACFEISTKFTNHGTDGDGTFRSTGGTKASATTRFSGKFNETVSVSGSTHKDSGKLTGKAKLGMKPAPPPAACKALLEKLP